MFRNDPAGQWSGYEAGRAGYPSFEAMRDQFSAHWLWALWVKLFFSLDSSLHLLPEGLESM